MSIFDKIQEIFWPAILAGGIAGLLLTGMQLFMITPMIIEAESYEVAEDDQGHTHEQESLMDSDHAHTEENEEAWAPADGAERTFYTFINSIIASIGFGLLLTACYALRGSVTWIKGILWGVAGFAVFHLATAGPTLGGLPPKLPGDMTAEPLWTAQMWWWFTAIATAAGLWIIAFQKSYIKLAGVVLIILPHLFGAPQPQEAGGLAPQDLRDRFISTSLATNAVFWVVLGILSAWFFNKIGKSTSTA